APGAAAELQAGALELGAALEEAVHLGEREEANPAVRSGVDHREEPREEAGVVRRDLLDEPGIAGTEPAERLLEIAQRGLSAPGLQQAVRPRRACQAAREARAAEGRETRGEQWPDQEPADQRDEGDAEGQQHERRQSRRQIGHAFRLYGP